MVAWVAACTVWPAADLPAGYFEPVRSDAPTLLLSGALDPVTPPRWGEEVLRGLGNARHVVAPGAGHGVLVRGCTADVIARFIDAGSHADLDVSCIGTGWGEHERRPADLLSPPPSSRGSPGCCSGRRSSSAGCESRPVATKCYGCYFHGMRTITQRELRNESTAILRAVQAGQSVMVTRNGTPVAELKPVSPRRFVPRGAIAQAAATAPPIDAARFRRDVDTLVDQGFDV